MLWAPGLCNFSYGSSCLEVYVFQLSAVRSWRKKNNKNHPGRPDQSRINSESFVHSICVGVRRSQGFENQSLQEEIGMKLRGNLCEQQPRGEQPCPGSRIAPSSAKEISCPAFHSFMEIHPQPFSEPARLWFYLEIICEESPVEPQEKVDGPGSLCTLKPASPHHLTLCLPDRFCIFFFLLICFFRSLQNTKSSWIWFNFFF